MEIALSIHRGSHLAKSPPAIDVGYCTKNDFGIDEYQIRDLHNLRDRLRAIECPADIIDVIGGWTTDGVGHQYGQGHRLAVTHGWMKIITPS